MHQYYFRVKWSVLLLLVTCVVTAQVKLPSAKVPIIIASSVSRTITDKAQTLNIGVVASSSYTATTTADWLTVTKGTSGVSLAATTNAGSARSASIIFSDGTNSKTLTLTQQANLASFAYTATLKTVTSATATSSYSGKGIENSYDGNTSTFYHSDYPYHDVTVSTPVTLIYNFDACHLDYFTYTPRQDGNNNGNFGQVAIYYKTSGSSDYILYENHNFQMSSYASAVNFGTSGIDNVVSVKFVVSTGSNNNASCAEMQFFSNDTQSSDYAIFADDLYSTLKTGTTQADIDKLTDPFVKPLAQALFNGTYSEKYRVAEFQPYRPTGNLSSELKTSTYDSYENPTGIYFESGVKQVLIVSGIPSEENVRLIIKSFGHDSSESHAQSSYALRNGINTLTPTNRGNGYISYYTLNYATAPNVKIHFVEGLENGYFSLSRGDTDNDWIALLAHACSDNIDVITPRIHVAGVTDLYKTYCPKKGRELALVYDSIVYHEHEIMGLQLFNREPKNHQFARPVNDGMFADGIGAAAAFGSFGAEWSFPAQFSFWGMAHELGHVNQVRPGLKWVGCGETTNNIYSAWVEHTMGTGYHRLEDENSGVDAYSGLRGGRFEVYLEEGVRKGVYWQLQDGPDYHGATAESKTVDHIAYDGTNGGSVTTTSRNYDHFVKVVPLWQLVLYTQQVGASVNAYGRVIEGIRNYANESSLTNGQLQIKFIRSFCDETGINFLPFFEKAGMLKPIDAYIEDYSPGWLVISQTAIDELKSYIAAKNYATAPAALNYINAYNWKLFRDKTPVSSAAVGTGCSVVTDASRGNRISVDNTVWNAVGYETYDASNNLIAISMYGLGDSQLSDHYTQVLWPSGASYIKAVGYDGSSVTCYSAN
jgi:hypothetical protein